MPLPGNFNRHRKTIMSPTFEALYHQADTALIYFFRLAENPMLGYLIGIALLGILCAMAGDLTISLAIRVNGAFLDRDNAELVRMQNQSLLALQARDKESYQACNSLANDSFGKVFFRQMALGASSLWPVPFALQWLDNRFAEVAFLLPIPLGDRTSVGYAFTFIPMYILMRILFGKVRTRLPGYRRLTVPAATPDPESETLLRVEDVFPAKECRTHQAGTCSST